MCERCTADEIIDALYIRKGFDEWWDSLDKDVQKEILQVLADVIPW